MEFTLPGRPFSRSYGTILPSSLTRVSSLTLVFSTCPPVLVLGTGTSVLPRGFSWRHGYTDSPAVKPAGLAPRVRTPRRIFLPRLATRLPQDNHRLGSVPLPRHPIGHSGRDVVGECHPVGHRLRLSASPEVPTNPEQANFTQETLDNRWRGFSPLLRYSCRHSHFLPLHGRSRARFAAYRNALLPIKPSADGSIPQLRRLA